MARRSSLVGFDVMLNDNAAGGGSNISLGTGERHNATPYAGVLASWYAAQHLLDVALTSADALMATVSVILPTYNRLAYLGQAVESVLRQTYQDWELIVVDDGSTDGTRDYLAALADQRVSTITMAHSGSPPTARNAAIARARGEWVAFLDSDDLWHPSKLDVQLRALAEHPQCGWGCANVGFIDSHAAPVPQSAGEAYRAHTGRILEMLIASTANVPTATLIVRRELLLQVGPLDERLSCRDDIDIALRLAARSEINAIAETLAFVRIHEGRTTGATLASELFRQNEFVFRKAATSAQHAALRRACERRCAIELVSAARALSHEGRHGEALSTLKQAAFDDPAAPRVWRALAGVVVRALRTGRSAAAQV